MIHKIIPERIFYHPEEYEKYKREYPQSKRAKKHKMYKQEYEEYKQKLHALQSGIQSVYKNKEYKRYRRCLQFLQSCIKKTDKKTVIFGFAEYYAKHHFEKIGYKVLRCVRDFSFFEGYNKKLPSRKEFVSKRLQRWEESYNFRLNELKNRTYMKEFIRIMEQNKGKTEQIIINRAHEHYDWLLKRNSNVKTVMDCIGIKNFNYIHSCSRRQGIRLGYVRQEKGLGEPDFFVYKPNKKECFFAEIKSQEDRLKRNQKCFISKVMFIKKICECKVVYVLPYGCKERQNPISWEYESVKDAWKHRSK